MAVRIRIRRDTAANWTSANPILALGEIGAETNTGRLKIGDGSSVWASLPYIATFTASSSIGAATAIAAASGIALQGWNRELQFVKGFGNAPTIVTATPQVQAGAFVGQELLLFGTQSSPGGTVQLSNGTGLALNGACVLSNGSSLLLIWNGSVWAEVSRNDV